MGSCVELFQFGLFVVLDGCVNSEFHALDELGDVFFLGARNTIVELLAYVVSIVSEGSSFYCGKVNA